jgi:competence protein ComEA
MRGLRIGRGSRTSAGLRPTAGSLLSVLLHVLLHVLLLCSCLWPSGCSFPGLAGRAGGGEGASILLSGSHGADSQPGGGESIAQASEPGDRPEAAEKVEHIYVHVAGAVVKPGVYRLLAGSRACDAVALAGGGGTRACLEAVNLAAQLSDGQQLYVPTREEVAATGGRPGLGTWTGGVPAAGGGGLQPGPLNVNLASESALESLPGIGPVLAERIVAYREAHGPFETTEDLLKVSGIGPGKLADLKDRVTVR